MSIADILVVDDAPANLQVLSSLLKGHGYKVRLSPSGKLALQAARQSPPDLILLDVNMPELSGYDVAEQLKQDPLLRDIPVIFLSALHETTDKVRAFAAGGVDYVTKPFQFEEVEARVRTHLKLRRLQAELEQHSRSLEDANRELRRLQELHDNLTSMIVHDLRSPLTAVVANLDFLKKTEPTISPAGIECLDDARDSSKTLIGMVGSLLDVSAMEAGRLELRRADCDLVALCGDAIRTVADTHQRHLVISAAAPPPPVSADRELLLRVLQNLIANACRFTSPGGRVEVSIAAAPAAVRVTVQDDGPGIAPEFHTRIFEKFGQVTGTGPRVGTGLGLTFCKLAIEAHGGRIGVDSQVRLGSTFWFEIPTTAVAIAAAP